MCSAWMARCRCRLVTACLALTASIASAGDEEPLLVPKIAGPWWQATGNPDLGKWTSERQQPVDFGVWQAVDGKWQLWSCIRGTKCGGSTRLFYGWESDKLTAEHWKPKGIAMTADPALGETSGGLQAPHVIVVEGTYYMFYGDWANICLAKSNDGKQFTRVLDSRGRPQLFAEERPGQWTNTRDAMVLPAGENYYCYYTAFPDRQGVVFCRTSKDFASWSESKVVAFGGSAGKGASSAECPHVIYHDECGQYYLFRTQRYGRNAQTTVYRSKDPLDFGVNDDKYLACRLPVAAPEIVVHNGEWFIAALRPGLDGIQIARLQWGPRPKPGRSLFDLDNAEVRAKWRRVEGDIEPVFTTSARQSFNPPYRYFIGTAESSRKPGHPDDAQTGIIESPEFTLEDDGYLFHVSGGIDGKTTYVAVVDAKSGEEFLRLTSPAQDNSFQAIPVDLRKHVKGKAKIRIVDRATGGWGHINFGGMFVDTSRPMPSRSPKTGSTKQLQSP